MRVFRIGAAVFTRTRKEAFSGQGGVYASARWHSAGRPIVYTAQSLSLAAFEILVRLKQTNDIQAFYAYSMEIPDHLILTPKSLPVRWKSRIGVYAGSELSNILLSPLSATRSLCAIPAHRFEIVDIPCGPWQGFAADLMDLAEVLMRRVEQNVVSLRRNGCRYF